MQRVLYILSIPPNDIEKLDLILDSGGGDIDTAYKILRMLKCYAKEVNVIVPFFCKSAASLIALGANHLYMCRGGELGPLDPQVKDPFTDNFIPAHSIKEAINFIEETKDPIVKLSLTDKIPVLLIGAYREAGESSKQYLDEIFADNGAEASDPTKAAGHGADPQEYHHWVDSHFNNTFANWGNGDSILGIGPGWAQVGNTPLFREKGLETEGGTRVPMLIKMTGKSQESSSNAFTRVADVSATILDYANVVHPGTTYKGQKVHSMEGKTIRPIIDGTVAQIYDEDEAVSAELFGNSAVYKGDYKALLLVPPLGDGKWKLFDLSHDIGEQNDLSSKYPDKLDEMVKDYNDYSNRVGVVPPLGLDLSVFSAGDTQ